MSVQMGKTLHVTATVSESHRIEIELRDFAVGAEVEVTVQESPDSRRRAIDVVRSRPASSAKSATRIDADLRAERSAWDR